MKGKEAEAKRRRREAKRRENRLENEYRRYAASLRPLARHLREAHPHLGRRGARMIVCAIDRVWRKLSYRKYRSYLKHDGRARTALGLTGAPSISTLQRHTKKISGMTGVLREILLWQAGRRARHARGRLLGVLHMRKEGLAQRKVRKPEGEELCKAQRARMP